MQVFFDVWEITLKQVCEMRCISNCARILGTVLFETNTFEEKFKIIQKKKTDGSFYKQIVKKQKFLLTTKERVYIINYKYI